MKEKNIVEEKMITALRCTQKVRSGLETVKAAWEVGHFYDCEEFLSQIQDASERLTLITRWLTFTVNQRPDREPEKDVTLAAVPVEMGYTEQGWFHVRLPLILPKKKRGGHDYIRGILYAAFERYFRGKRQPRFEDCVLIYRHVYDRMRPERQYRDHDNIELNMVTDTVALYVMTDDTPMRCRHYYCSATADWERTEVYVVPCEEFAQWLALEHSIPEEGLALFHPDFHIQEALV